MANWSNINKLWTYIFEPNEIEKRITSQRRQSDSSAGVTAPDSIPNLLGGGEDGSLWGGSRSPLRISTSDGSDFIDLSSITNRMSRYKEYDRLENVAEIVTALNTFADESCVSGDTNVMTPFGPISIEQLAKNKKPDEDFLVYCWDFEKNDYTLGWAYHPRMVKVAPTVQIFLDNGDKFTCTTDHRILQQDGNWVEAGSLKVNDLLKPFYRTKANSNLNKTKTLQFPRIFTFTKGWIHEKQFLDEFKNGGPLEKYKKLNKIIRYLQKDLTVAQVEEAVGDYWATIGQTLKREGFSKKEIELLASKHKDHRRVICIKPYKEMPVYDLSVRDHQNFASDSVIFHNCQEDDEGHIYKIKCDNQLVQKEIDLLLNKVLNMDDKCWGIMRNLCKYGDFFLELIVDTYDPKKYGLIGIQPLPPDSVHRIETIKGRLVEFQQSKDGPDYESIQRVDVLKANNAEIAQAKAIRFTPEQIIHLRLGDDRKEFYPYGVSVVDAARGPAHLLRMMEDAMLVNRIVRSPERRVFYIDIGTLPPNKGEAFMERMKDQFRKKKVFAQRGSGQGASAVEERMHVPGLDEDFWIPLRPNQNTRIETLPGAQNLSDTEDVNYFKIKLLIALNFPQNYLSNNDPQASRLTLSQQDVRFARFVERLQKPLQKGLLEIARRHLRIKGVPEELYDDLEIEMTPPSDWRRINRNEVTQANFDRAATLKGSKLMSDYDIYVKIFQESPEHAKELVSRMKAQNLEELRMQLIGSNPGLLGIENPDEKGTEIGTKPGGPSPEIGEDGEENPEQGQGQSQGQEQGQQQEPEQNPDAAAGSATPLPEISDDDAKKYGLDISDYVKDMDVEEIDANDTI